MRREWKSMPEDYLVDIPRERRIASLTIDITIRKSSCSKQWIKLVVLHIDHHWPPWSFKDDEDISVSYKWIYSSYIVIYHDLYRNLGDYDTKVRETAVNLKYLNGKDIYLYLTDSCYSRTSQRQVAKPQYSFRDIVFRYLPELAYEIKF